jgi:hypothetical protein
MATYAATYELRHCLVHRAVYTNASGALIWHDRQGNAGRPVTRDEQDAFARAVLRAAQLIVQLQDRPGQELRGRLEHAPDQVVSIDPAAPPSWLS